MVATILLPLLVSAASNNSYTVKNGDNQTDILEEKGKEEVKEWRRRVQMDLVKWMEEGPMADGESSQLWRNVLQQWNELNREDREKWEETAWSMVTNGTEDDSLSSLLDWEDEEEEPMINITSRITVYVPDSPPLRSIPDHPPHGGNNGDSFVFCQCCQYQCTFSSIRNDVLCIV